jgi:hypothetical protein
MNNKKYKHVRVVSCAYKVNVNHGCGTEWKGGWAAECWGGVARANVAKALTCRVSGRGPSFRFIVASRHLCRPTTKAAAVGPPIGTVCAHSRPATHAPRNTFALFSTRNRHPHVAALHRCMSTTHANMSTPRGGRGGRGPRGGGSNYTRGFGQARSNGDAPKPTPDRPAQGVYTRGGRREQRADTRPPPAAAQAHARTRAPEEARRKYSPPPLTCGADRRQFEDASFHDATPGPRLHHEAALATAANCAVRGIY